MEAASLIANKLDATIKHVDWPKIDLCLETGHTSFDGRLLLENLNTSIKHSFKKWAMNP